jgi:hypothetical protein
MGWPVGRRGVFVLVCESSVFLGGTAVGGGVEAEVEVEVEAVGGVEVAGREAELDATA